MQASAEVRQYPIDEGIEKGLFDTTDVEIGPGSSYPSPNKDIRGEQHIW